MSRTRHSRLGATLFVSAVLLAVAGPGCGQRGAGPAQAPVNMSALSPAPDVKMYVEVKPASSDAEPFADSVRSNMVSTLSSAGYKLVESKDANPDVFARVLISAVEEKSLFQTQVNGKVQKSYSITLDASLLAAADAGVIDQAQSTFSGEDGAVDKTAVDRLVYTLNKSPKLTKWVEDGKARVEKTEEDLWTAANVEGCKTAKSQDACKGVHEYIAKYPTGKHVAEGRQAIEDGKSAAAAGEEEKAWAAAVVDQCKKPTKSYDCKDVDRYLAKYPTGTHAAEAKDAIKSSEKAREALKKKEDAAQKRENRADCIKSCKSEYERYYAYEVLVNRCIQNECN
jgi:hypothetical protein